MKIVGLNRIKNYGKQLDFEWGILKAPPVNPRAYIYRYYNIDLTNISTFLLRKGLLLIHGMAASLRRDGVMNLHELCMEEETQRFWREPCHCSLFYFPSIKLRPDKHNNRTDNCIISPKFLL